MCMNDLTMISPQTTPINLPIHLGQVGLPLTLVSVQYARYRLSCSLILEGLLEIGRIDILRENTRKRAHTLDQYWIRNNPHSLSGDPYTGPSSVFLHILVVELYSLSLYYTQMIQFESTGNIVSNNHNNNNNNSNNKKTTAIVLGHWL